MFKQLVLLIREWVAFRFLNIAFFVAPVKMRLYLTAGVAVGLNEYHAEFYK